MSDKIFSGGFFDQFPAQHEIWLWMSGDGVKVPAGENGAGEFEVVSADDDVWGTVNGCQRGLTGWPNSSA